MKTQSHFLDDILRQPAELGRAIDYLTGAGQEALQEAAAMVRGVQDVFLTGIGASLNVAINAGALFHLNGHPVYVQEAAELVHFLPVPSGAVIIAISRTGRSIEILQLLDRARASGARVIGITNGSDSPLAKEAAISIIVPVPFDHAISVNTYSTLSIAAGALAVSAATGFGAIASSLACTVAETGRCLLTWQKRLAESAWLEGGVPYYFLARGCSVGTCHQARLLWEEAGKSPATSMTTSGFRHGPQEIVRKGTRFCMWIDSSRMRNQDMAVADDLKQLGASVMLIGENLSEDSGDLVFSLPRTPANWQFVTDIMPVQLAAERLATLMRVDCDAFRICSYIVQDEHGLLRKNAEVSRGDH